MARMATVKDRFMALSGASLRAACVTERERDLPVLGHVKSLAAGFSRF